MKNTVILIAAWAMPALLFSQEWTPKLTQKYEPVPPVVIPGQNSSPPSDAIVLFDGRNLDEWESSDGGPVAWKLEDGAMTVVRGAGGIRTKRGFRDIQLHIEWRSPAEVVGDGQGRGNSGIYLQNRYEVQVLDSYENDTYVNGQAGAIYKQHIPLVNACRPPGEWQSYDIIYTAPRFKENGSLFSPATVTVLHNGVLIQNHVTIQGTTENLGLPKYEPFEPLQPIFLQDHGNPVSYRNIWVREL
jgi:hypothetical protein